MFSSRRESITADVRERAARFEQRDGRKPSQRELAQLAQASNFATRTAKEGALDFAQLHTGWADKLARTLGVSLAPVAPSVWHSAAGRAAAHPHDSPGPVLTELELARAAQKAVALAQPLQARPLLRLNDDVVVLDEQYLVERVTRGLHWLVHDHEKTVYGENPRRAWIQVWSEMIETRAEDELRQLAPRLIGGGRAFFTKKACGPRSVPARTATTGSTSAATSSSPRSSPAR